jgi:hypothetical protein
MHSQAPMIMKTITFCHSDSGIKGANGANYARFGLPGALP